MVVAVSGVSMAPTLWPGDRVLVRRVPVGRVSREDLVVVRKPRDPGRAWLVKRVLAVPGDPLPRREVPLFEGYPHDVVPAGRLVVLGDNPAESYDSRAFGYVRGDDVLGVVVRTFRGRRGATPTSGAGAGR